MKETIKISVDKEVISALKKSKKVNKYIETLLKKEALKNRFDSLFEKLNTGYDLGGFKREDIYDRA